MLSMQRPLPSVLIAIPWLFRVPVKSSLAKQHRVGELTFWSALPIDPLDVALRLWTVSADVEARERTVFRARQQIDMAKAYS
jgi:hypothetical protein